MRTAVVALAFVSLCACGAKSPSLTSATLPVISFDEGPIVGKVARASAATWSATPDDVRFAWQHCDSIGSCSPISGATGRVYAIALADEDQGLRFDETATLGTTTVVASSLVSAAIDKTPIQIEIGQISGMYTVGGLMTLIPGQFDRSVQLGNYQWAMCTGTTNCAPVGANLDSYTGAAGDVGKTARVRYEAVHLGAKLQLEVFAPSPITN